jgi:hypothetical protein
VDTFLWGVTARAFNDVWAVGHYSVEDNNGAVTYIALTMHWNGVEWSNVTVPDLGSSVAFLTSVAAASSDDVWAVGWYTDQNGTQNPPMKPLLIHWNGSAWSFQPNAAYQYPQARLDGVTVVAADDVWAVGAYFESGKGYTLTLHYDGNVWTIIPSPEPGPEANGLVAVDAISTNDVWAVGSFQSNTYAQFALALHWDGTEWSYVPDDQYDRYIFYGVAAVSHNDVWAVGEYPGPNAYQQPLVQHWDGVYWTVVPVPSAGIYRNHLFGVAAVSSADIWAVGEYEGTNDNRVIIEHYSTPCPLSVTTPTTTSSTTPTTAPMATGTASATRTAQRTSTSTSPATSTATSTPVKSSTPTRPPDATQTPCRIEFADVAATNAFYSYIRCMACGGVISGYSCGQIPSEPCGPGREPYFRPGLDVTRGQISKMVALAAQLSGPTGDPLFEDVEPGDTFYSPIQQLARRGYIGGYPCGRASEPCGEGSLPYFRPGANTTRGQLSKIVSEAAQITDAPGPYKFADVPVGSPFFVWINRLANRGVIGGYPCGGAGEACDAQHRAYFRPNENVTRGQTAKIVSNSFFPNCQAGASPAVSAAMRGVSASIVL